MSRKLSELKESILADGVIDKSEVKTISQSAVCRCSAAQKAFVAILFLVSACTMAVAQQLTTGSTPYSYFYGGNPSCDDYGCSQIIVRTPSSSDVLVTIKKNGKVVRHAYIRAKSSFTFQIPDGTYQPFFYYGKQWDSNKAMKSTSSGILRGGFTTNEVFGKDDPVTLSNQSLTYELILQKNGNFSTRPSNAQDAL